MANKTYCDWCNKQTYPAVLTYNKHIEIRYGGHLGWVLDLCYGADGCCYTKFQRFIDGKGDTDGTN